MPSQSNYGEMVYLAGLESNAPESIKLARLHFSKNNQGSAYDEKWLQKLITKFPGLLPVTSIEPAYGGMTAICEEFEIRGQFIDNLFLTPAGDIAIVECKLWRNPEARREVVGQIVEYASMLSRLTYEEFERGVLSTKVRATGASLFRMLFQAGHGDESDFHDAVARNLRRGRFLLMIVGDGIREGLETMTDRLQREIGLQFNLNLIELGIFQLPNGSYVAQSRILGRTTTIERLVVMVPDASVKLAETAGIANRPMSGSITLEAFYDALGKSRSQTAPLLRKLLERLEESETNVKADLSDKTLTLRWVHGSRGWNLGTITQDGTLWMDYHLQQSRNANLSNESRRYLDALAGISPHLQVAVQGKLGQWNLMTTAGTSPNVTDLLGGSGIATWTSAIQQFQLDVTQKDQD